VDDSEASLVHEVTRSQVDYQIAQHGECHLVDRLKTAGCPQFAERVRLHLQTLY